MQPPNVHDALVKTAFSEIQHAEGFLRLVLPPALVARIDFSTLALRPGSFVDEALKERHSDLLYSVAIFEELYDVDPATLAALGEHAVRFRFALDDLSFADDDALKARAMSAFARLVLFCLRHVREPAVLLQRLGRWVDLVGEARRAPNGPAALVALFRYILVTNRELEPEAIVEQLLAAVGEEGKEQILSAGEKLIERGRQEGLLKGRRELLLKLLGTRFGALPAGVVARVNEADLDQLDRWFERGIAALALVAVFDEV